MPLNEWLDENMSRIDGFVDEMTDYLQEKIRKMVSLSEEDEKEDGNLEMKMMDMVIEEEEDEEEEEEEKKSGDLKEGEEGDGDEGDGSPQESALAQHREDPVTITHLVKVHQFLLTHKEGIETSMLSIHHDHNEGGDGGGGGGDGGDMMSSPSSHQHQNDHVDNEGSDEVKKNDEHEGGDDDDEDEEDTIEDNGEGNDMTSSSSSQHQQQHQSSLITYLPSLLLNLGQVPPEYDENASTASSSSHIPSPSSSSSTTTTQSKSEKKLEDGIIQAMKEIDTLMTNLKTKPDFDEKMRKIDKKGIIYKVVDENFELNEEDVASTNDENASESSVSSSFVPIQSLSTLYIITRRMSSSVDRGVLMYQILHHLLPHFIANLTPSVLNLLTSPSTALSPAFLEYFTSSSSPSSSSSSSSSSSQLVLVVDSLQFNSSHHSLPTSWFVQMKWIVEVMLPSSLRCVCVLYPSNDFVEICRF